MRKKKARSKQKEEVENFDIPNVLSPFFADKEELRPHLENRIRTLRMICPMVLLCKLQNATLDSVRLTDKILEFDAEQIRFALSVLQGQGLE